MMKEELYVYDGNGTAHKIELGSGTKITLKWENNLFKSIDKISCSYSYTFKIPLTRANTIAFDLADDIRHKSGMAWRKLKAEYTQNGIPLFRNGYLYISKVSDGYQCAFTFNVLDGLQQLSDEDVSLQDLREKLFTNIEGGVTWWGDNEYTGSSVSHGDPSEFDNTIMALHPDYWAGVEGYKLGAFRSITPKYPPLPVVPAKYLLNCINDLYGVNIQLGKEVKGSSALSAFEAADIYKDENVVTYGAVALVNAQLTAEQEEANAVKLKYKGFRASTWGFSTEYMLTFSEMNVTTHETAEYIKPMYVKTSGLGAAAVFSKKVPTDDDINNHTYISTSIPSGETASNWTLMGFYTAFGVKVRGSFVVQTTNGIKFDGDKEKDESVFKLKVMRLNIKDTYKDTKNGKGTIWEISDETTISNASGNEALSMYSNNVYDASGSFLYAQYYFNFNSEEGYDDASVGDEGTANNKDGHDAHYYFFAFDGDVVKQMVQISDFTIIPQINDAKKITHQVDVFTSLPDIGCLSFIKSLFYAMGEYPYIDADGAIRGSGYADFDARIKDGDAYQWDDKLLDNDGTPPEEISYKAGDFIQKNYYLTKWDDLDRTEADLKEEEEVYEDGIGCILSENETLSEKETVFTYPFYSPFILDRKNPTMWTGDSVHFWSFEYPDITYKECKPVYGIINKWQKVIRNTTFDKDTYAALQETKYVNAYDASQKVHVSRMEFDVLSPFADIERNRNYAYLQRIVRNPVMITEKLYLNEADLASLDMRRPVYLGKYGSYFALITLQRSSDGICKAELLRLPSVASVTITLYPTESSGYTKLAWIVSEALAYPVTLSITAYAATSWYTAYVTIPVGQTSGEDAFTSPLAMISVKAEVSSVDEKDMNTYTVICKDGAIDDYNAVQDEGKTITITLSASQTSSGTYNVAWSMSEASDYDISMLLEINGTSSSEVLSITAGETNGVGSTEYSSITSVNVARLTQGTNDNNKYHVKTDINTSGGDSGEVKEAKDITITVFMINGFLEWESDVALTYPVTLYVTLYSTISKYVEYLSLEEGETNGTSGVEYPETIVSVEAEVTNKQENDNNTYTIVIGQEEV